MRNISVGRFKIGSGQPLLLIAGPCVIEDKKTVFEIASQVKKITSLLKIPYVFKASYDKANRTSIESFRGPGLVKGLEILEEVKEKFDLPVLSDIHSSEEAREAAHVLDIMQIPAFLCRQTDLLVAAGKTKRVINIKKGQFLAPNDIQQAVKKVEHTGNKNILLTERGTSFGYNNLVTDFRAIKIMRDVSGYPVVFDATHSVQQPGGLGKVSGGKSEFIPLLARCGVAAGCDAVFLEVHTNPKRALSDGPNMLPINKLESLLKDLIAIHNIVSRKK
jgi:2-dehydro-3-deoxyphosphooctonate aldolase (KDO 8-P synthase)